MLGKVSKNQRLFSFIANVTSCKSYAILSFRFLTQLGKVEYIFYIEHNHVTTTSEDKFHYLDQSLHLKPWYGNMLWKQIVLLDIILYIEIEETTQICS